MQWRNGEYHPPSKSGLGPQALCYKELQLGVSQTFDPLESRPPRNEVAPGIIYSKEKGWPSGHGHELVVGVVESRVQVLVPLKTRINFNQQRSHGSEFRRPKTSHYPKHAGQELEKTAYRTRILVGNFQRRGYHIPSYHPSWIPYQSPQAILTPCFLPRKRHLSSGDAKPDLGFNFHKPNTDTLGIFYIPYKSCDIAAANFLHHENPPTWAGVKPAILGAEGQRQTNHATQPRVNKC
ncbi:hypothetical protein TNCV_1027561 [Trichonephila clavipes]|nr:hypothetical protein TNCV_1027561 [Trichonephila clavipes]